MKKRRMALAIVLACLCMHTLAGAEGPESGFADELMNQVLNMRTEQTQTVTEQDVLGSWLGYSVMMNGQEYLMEEVGIEATLVLHEDGSAEFVHESMHDSGSWYIDHENGWVVVGNKCYEYADGTLRQVGSDNCAVYIRMPDELHMDADSETLMMIRGDDGTAGLRAEDVCGVWVYSRIVTDGQVFTAKELDAFMAMLINGDGTYILMSEEDMMNGLWHIEGSTVFVDDVPGRMVDGELHLSADGDEVIFSFMGE